MDEERQETYGLRERDGWEPGPWDGEPDRVEWRHNGTPCLVLRNHMGAWCGYAAVPPGHPWYEQKYDYDEGDDLHLHRLDAETHGGITFADFCMDEAIYGEDRRTLVCHVPHDGEPDDVWWFGFDCGHFMDRMPGHEATMREVYQRGFLSPPPDDYFGAVYRTLDYVCQRVNAMADMIMVASIVLDDE